MPNRGGGSGDRAANEISQSLRSFEMTGEGLLRNDGEASFEITEGCGASIWQTGVWSFEMANEGVISSGARNLPKTFPETIKISQKP